MLPVPVLLIVHCAPALKDNITSKAGSRHARQKVCTCVFIVIDVDYEGKGFEKEAPTDYFFAGIVIGLQKKVSISAFSNTYATNTFIFFKQS